MEVNFLYKRNTFNMHKNHLITGYFNFIQRENSRRRLHDKRQFFFEFVGKNNHLLSEYYTTTKEAILNISFKIKKRAVKDSDKENLKRKFLLNSTFLPGF